MYFAFQSFVGFFFLKVLIKIDNYMFPLCLFLPLDCKFIRHRIVLFTIIFPVCNAVLMQKHNMYLFNEYVKLFIITEPKIRNQSYSRMQPIMLE